ncbi:Ig-like domain-containing protein [Nannocystis bainbridge]|uniref:Ig-like domain-containing protein n=1 Tax=Nannocystis bainbridge TaxID=2995303 RepID=UPI00232CDA44|nr:Ig-like domain-containing protein [Nannocystis bainbridge]
MAALGHARSRVFFLNYDGVSLAQGEQDDATTDTTMFAEFVADYAPYGLGSKRDASLQAVLADWAAYDVTITDVRPQAGAYAMSVNSPTNPFGDGVTGASALDCDDGVASSVVLAFHGADDEFSAAAQATTISHELAHSYGLEHVAEPEEIMNPTLVGVDASFRDECLALTGGGPLHCEQHRRFCDDGRQNAHQELLWLFGPAVADTTPPVVTITSPADGDAFEAPALVTIVAEASDEIGLSAVTLRIDGLAQAGPDSLAPYRWLDRPFAAGSHCLTVEARDHGANVTVSQEVCFFVDPGEDEGLSTSSGASATAAEDSDSSGDAQERGDEGCGCAVRSSAGTAAWLVMLALGGVRRRRRAPSP